MDNRYFIAKPPKMSYPTSFTAIDIKADPATGTASEMGLVTIKDGITIYTRQSRVARPGEIETPGAPSWTDLWREIAAYIDGWDLTAHGMKECSSILMASAQSSGIPLPRPRAWWDTLKPLGGADMASALNYFGLGGGDNIGSCLKRAKGCAALMMALPSITGRTVIIPALEKPARETPTEEKAKEKPLKKEKREEEEKKKEEAKPEKTEEEGKIRWYKSIAEEKREAEEKKMMAMAAAVAKTKDDIPSYMSDFTRIEKCECTMIETADGDRSCATCEAKAQGINLPICLRRGFTEKNRIFNPDHTTCRAWKRRGGGRK